MIVLRRLFEGYNFSGVLFQKKNLSGYAGSFSRHQHTSLPDEFQVCRI